jgi:hypothetical protein
MALKCMFKSTLFDKMQIFVIAVNNILYEMCKLFKKIQHIFGLKSGLTQFFNLSAKFI